MAYRREVFLQLNGFGDFKNLHTGDDDLLLQRVREETNWKIKYIPEKSSQIYNAPPSSWQKFYQQRIRYASKGFIYPRRISQFLLTFYVFNLLLLSAPIVIISDLLYIIPLLGSLLLKGLSEYRFIDKAATVLHDRRFLYLFPIVFLLHIPYVLLFGLMGQFKRFEWGSHKS